MCILQDRKSTDIPIGEIMIPSEKVAHVQMNNPLEHALLVLVKSGYSAVPVLDVSFKLKGTIGKTAILNQILGLERFEFEKLSDMQVYPFMDGNIPYLTKDMTLMDGLNVSINNPFVCVSDVEGFFDGIVTRRAILKQIKRSYYTNRS